MTNRFEDSEQGFVDLAIRTLKKVKTFLDDIDKFMHWDVIEEYLNQKLKKRVDIVGNPAYPPLKMFKVLLLQRWYDLSDVGIEEVLGDTFSFRRFTRFSFDYNTPDSSTICRFRNTLVKMGLDEKLFEMINQQLESNGLLIKKRNYS